jgi:hypothetical protein
MMRRVAGVAAFGAAGIVAYRKLFRPWHERWGATEDEVRAHLPGDGFTAEPAEQVTRAITIEARPEDVWPWIVQIGADRGGFYSYDGLENLFGLDIHSSHGIVPAWQHRSIGDLVYGDRRGRGGWFVMEVTPGEALVMKTANLRSGQPLGRDEPPAFWEFTWAFVLQDRGDGTTRLVVRERVAFGKRVSAILLSPLGPVSFVMTRKMMRTIKARAEAGPVGAPRGEPIEIASGSLASRTP